MRESYTQREWDRIVGYGNPPPNPVVNYIVEHGSHITEGSYITECETVDEVWAAIGESWGCYFVTSPTGQDTDQFLPF